MNLRQILKANPFVKRLGKKINIDRAFKKDSADFKKYYVEEAVLNNDFSYSIMLLVHSLEKGMCMPNPRPFGVEKVHELISYLKSMESLSLNEFEYRLGLSILDSWCKFFEKHDWTNESIYKEVKVFLNNKNIVEIESGYKEYIVENQDLSEEYSKVIVSRHSVRDFKEDKLRIEDIEFAINCFIETPTACNRQMCSILYIDSQDIKELLDKKIIGLPGFNKPVTQYFVITYDLAGFAYSGERQQGMFNAGLCTTNFINGLHAKGIGSCCLQWSNKYSEDKIVRKALGLRSSERIAVVIGCGYYKKHNIIPCSVRKTKKEIFRIV